MSQSSATRDRLLEVSSRIKDIAFGKGLLEKKRDAFIRAMEGEKKLFYELQDQYRKLCSSIAAVYGLIRVYEGSHTIDLLRLQHPLLSLRLFRESLMGCRYTRFESEPSEIEHRFRLDMDPALSSLYIEELLFLLEQAESMLWRYITLRSKIQAFERELRKTNLKINTLEHSLLPSLSEEKKKILEVLSERERQERYTIKKLTGKKKRR
ncbi:H+transporting two-sector ATPase D subunit [Dethiosulfovibrio peptidovorans DSM 11002]|uniref:H+transporting two-sector ATPase D subunit n=1 Tax=Dethiosulfovibrio peptidovorans DSM 11002 TaxID=469381 RepID=D2Z3X8_9BACT|nr:V-type ATP synthase subunit D [Dethiosulfovibrio peptidovorans]EFC92239.1 H+transporting two-sector ATPase D subunit [Dethiosulfovibrio peptidovorans DSM 11002]